MSEKILSECLDLFEKKYFPRILPNPKYSQLVANQLGRYEMMQEGSKFNPQQCSLLALTCLSGDYSAFIDQFVQHNIQNLNQYFEATSRLSLLHFVMFGRKKLLMASQLNNARHQHIKIAQNLLSNDLFIDIQSKWGYSALHECVINCPDLEFATFLLKNDANPNLKSVFGDTPLHSTVMASSIEAMKLLCDYGADPRIREAFSDITPIYLARTHIEAQTILNNAKRKLESHMHTNKLEHEDVSYCIVCNVSSKIKKMFQCGKCRGIERYCSQKCQKKYWLKHKKECKINRNKMDVNNKMKELVFSVESAQGNVLPMAHMSAEHSENISDMFSQTDMETHRKKYRKKRNKKYEKQMKKFGKNVKNKSKLNEKFVIKIQTSNQSAIASKLLVYDKSRKYAVFICKKGQVSKWKELKKLIDKNGISGIMGQGAKKAYFYAWVDNKKKLHVLIDNVLALQPW
eukprot:211519_1